MKTVENLLKKDTDPYLALLAYRSTPLSLGYASSELLMCRKLRTNVPISCELRKPHIPDISAVAERDRREEQRQTENFNSRHRATELPPLEPGDTVYLQDRETEGTVVEESAPRSYRVDTQN